MLSLITVFWIFIIFFSIIGALRGWAKEVVATAGLVLSLFTLRLFGGQLMSLLGMVVDPTSGIDATVVLRRQFWVLAGIHLFIAFASYQGPTLAGGIGQRLRPRDTVQEKLLGSIIGALNGYLIVGTLYSFLEYRVAATGFERLAPGLPYPFSAETIVRPANAYDLAVLSYLPVEVLSGGVLPLVMVALFLIVLIAII